VSRASVLARGRAAAAAGMVDTCRIDYVADVDTNPLTGQVAKQRVIRYEGPCRVQQAAAPWAGPATVGEAALRLAALELQLPVVGSEGIQTEDRVTVLTCVHDTELVGRIFSVVGQHHASHKTTRRLPIQEVLS